MKVFGWSLAPVAAVVVWAGVIAAPALVQAQQPQPASMHGHVQNAAGVPITKGEIRLTNDRSGDTKTRKYQYTFPLDASGNYTGTGITPGAYAAIVFVDDKSVDFFDNEEFKAGENKTVDFDQTRPEYIAKMTPEEKKALEDYKKKNAEAAAANSKIADLNKSLLQARADTKAGNFDPAISSMTQATSQKPDEAILWVALGDAQLGKGDAATKAAKAAGKPATDPTIAQNFSDAASSYKKAIDANTASKKPNPETGAAAENQLGQALAKSGDTKGASDAYDAAAKADPTKAGQYLFNEAATLYNAGKTDDAAVAADKAIAADPNRAISYYIKGQALIGKATVDSKTNKITAPPGCVEAYQRFLELAPPDDPHAEEVKSILTGIGAPVKSSYKAGKKS